MFSGLHDPIVGGESKTRLQGLLSALGANVEAHALPVGHQLSQADPTHLQRWLRSTEPIVLDGPRRAEAAGNGTGSSRLSGVSAARPTGPRG